MVEKREPPKEILLELSAINLDVLKVLKQFFEESHLKYLRGTGRVRYDVEIWALDREIASRTVSPVRSDPEDYDQTVNEFPYKLD